MTFSYILIWILAPLKRYYDFFVLFSFPMVFVMFYILSSWSPHFLYTSYLCLDSISFLLVYITFLVLVLSYLSHDFSEQDLWQVYFVFISLLASSYLVFTSSNLLCLYVAYEASLIPISYVILKWGVYPDKSVSALVMLLFTGFFTLPLSLLLFSLYLDHGSFMIFTFSLISSSSFGFCLWVLLAFAVKLPLYGIHYWLPMAHVEAPTFGSMVLAGLLLKMGGCGLIRFMPLFSFVQAALISSLMSYFVFAVLAASVVCCVQSDMKRLVAYSSVLHMSILPLLLLSMNAVSHMSMLMLMVFHGLSSPLLFLYVGVIYQLNKTRLIVLLRGMLLFSPMLAFWGVMVFLLNVPVPPVPSFISEVLSFLAVFSTIGFWSLLLAGVVMFLVMLYSLSWLVPLIFSISPTYYSSVKIRLSFCLILFSFVLIMTGFIPLMFLFTL